MTNPQIFKELLKINYLNVFWESKYVTGFKEKFSESTGLRQK